MSLMTPKQSGRFPFSVGRPLGIVLVTGKDQSTVPLTSEEFLKNILVVQATKPIAGLISRQWLTDASIRRAAKNIAAQYQSVDEMDTDKEEIPPIIKYIGIIFKPLVYIKAIDTRTRSVIQASNTKMIDSIVEALAFLFQREIQKYARGERTSMEKDNIDLYFHFAKFRPLISNATTGTVITLAFYNTEVMTELLKIDSVLYDKGHDVKVNKGADTLHLYFFYDKKLEHSVWKNMPEKGAKFDKSGITRRLEDAKKSRGSSTVPIPVIDYSLYEVNYASPSIYMNPLVNTRARKELAIIEISLASIGLDPHSFSSSELTGDETQAEMCIKDIKYGVCASIGQEKRFDFKSIQSECCLYDRMHIKLRARIPSSLEAAGLIKAAEDIKKDKARERMQKKEEQAKLKEELDAFKTPEEKYKELYDPTMAISYYDDNNNAVNGMVKVASVMRFARKVSPEELARIDELGGEFDRVKCEQELLEMYGPDGAFY